MREALNTRRSLLAVLGMSLVMTSAGCGGVDYPVVTPSVPRPYPTPVGAAVPSVRPVVPLAPVFIGQPEEGVLPNGVRVRVYTDASLPLAADRAKQNRPLITYTESRVTNPVTGDNYSAPLPADRIRAR